MRDELAKVLQPFDTDLVLRGGTARVSNDNPVEVEWKGQTGLPASYAANYTPTIGDLVALLILADTDLFIINRIQPDGG